MSNKNIKGITIEIGGNTTGLDKALKDVNDKSYSLNSELREVEKLLKLDPTNTELLAQKQEILAQSVENAKKKLSSLEDAQSQIEQQFQNGEIDDGQYRAFQREIQSSQQYLQRLEQELDTASRNLNEFGNNNGVAEDEARQLNEAIEAQRQETERLREAEEQQRQEGERCQEAEEERRTTLDESRATIDESKSSIAEHSEALKDMGEKAAGAVTAVAGAMAGVAAYATKFSDDFQKSLNGIISSTGATSDEAKDFEQIMQNIYADNFGEDFDDIAESVGTVHKSLSNLSGDELKNATENALMLRDTFGFDVAESVNAADQLMQQFGIGADEAFNLIVQGAQNGLDENGDLLDTIKEFSGDFSGVGMSAQEMFNVLSSGTGNSAYNMNLIGDAMNEFGIRTKEGTDDAKSAFEDLGLTVGDYSDSISNVQGEMDGYSDKIKSLEGKLNDAYYQQSKFTDATDDYTRAKNQQAIDDYTAEISDLSEKYNTCGNSLRELNDKQNQSRISFEDFQQKLAKGGPEAKEAFDQVINAIAEIEDPIEQQKTGVALFGTMWEDMGGQAILSLKNTQGEISTTKDALSDINNTKYNDICSQLEGLKRNFETDIIKPLGDDVKPIVSEVIETVQKKLPDVKQKISDVINAIKPHIPAIKDVLKTIVDKIKEFARFIIDNKEAIITALTAIVTGLVAFNVASIIMNLVRAFLIWRNATIGMTLVQAAFNAVNPAAWIGLVVAGIVLLVGWIIHLWNTCEPFRNFVLDMFERIKAAFDLFLLVAQITIDAVIGVFRNIVDWLKNAFEIDWSERFGMFGEILNAFFTNVQNIFDGVKGIFDAIIAFIRDVFQGNWSNVWSDIKNIFKSVWDSFLEIAKAPLNSILGLINMVIDGINSMIGDLNSISVTIPDWVPNIGGNSFGISIPTVPNIPYLAKGGILSQGSAVVGEAGAELLTVANGRAIVQPLTGNSTSATTNTTINNNAIGTNKMSQIVVMLDSKVLAKTTAPASDLVNGSRITLSGRGVAIP